MIIPFICVNYNSSEETKKYIINVISLDNSGQAIIVVVDNSTDDNEFIVLKEFIKENGIDDNKVIVLKKENRGYFQGLNDGLDFIQKSKQKFRFVIVGNNDITFKNNFINELNKIKFDNDVFVLAPDVVTKDGSHENPHVINKIGFFRKFKYDIFFSNYHVAKILRDVDSLHIRPYKLYDSERKNIHMGIGALYILTENFFQHYKKLSEEVFLYGEEAILAGQLAAKNGKTLYDPSLVCYHNESTTTSRINSKRIYYFMQESYKKYRKYL